MTIRTRPLNFKLSQLRQGHEAISSELVFVGLVVIWGITFVFSRDALQVVGPFAYNTTRMLLGAVTLVILAGPHWKVINRAYLRPSLVTGAVLFVSYATQAYGQQFTTASKAGFLTGTSLVYVPIFSALFLRRVPGRFAVIGVGLAFIGLALLSVQGKWEELALAQGDLFVALSGVGWAFYIIILAYYSPHLSILPFAALHVLIAALMNGVSWGLIEPLYLPLNSAALWLGVLTTGFLILGLGTSIQTWVTRWASPTRVGLIAAMEPLFAGLAGWWVGETITLPIILGGTLIISGVLISEIRK